MKADKKSSVVTKTKNGIGAVGNVLAEPAAAYHIKQQPSTTQRFYQRSVSLLGMEGSKAYTHISNNTDFIAVIRNGVPKKALDTLMDNTGITVNEIAAIIRTSDRTLRRYTPQQKLDPSQSERVIELAKLYSRGEDVFGSMDSFIEWMNSSIMALGDKRPKEFLDTSVGIDMLMDELGRIEQGIFA